MRKRPFRWQDPFLFARVSGRSCFNSMALEVHVLLVIQPPNVFLVQLHGKSFQLATYKHGHQ